MKAAVKVNNAAPWQYPAKTSRRTPPKDCNICEDHIIGLELNLNSRRLGGGLQKIVYLETSRFFHCSFNYI